MLSLSDTLQLRMVIMEGFDMPKSTRDYNLNYYLEGRYFDGSQYHEVMTSDTEAWIEIGSICEAAEEFIKMGSPKEHAKSVVNPVGLHFIQEIDSTYIAKEI